MIACQLISNDLVEASPRFYSRIGKRKQHASKPFLFRWMAMNSLRFLEASQSFYSCISRWSPNASKSLLLNWKVLNSLRCLEVSIRALGALAGEIKMLQNHCFSVVKQDSLKASQVSTWIGRCNPGASKTLPVDWKATTSFKLLDVSRFLFVHWLVQSKCFQIIAFQLKSKEFLEVSQSFYSCIGRCGPNAFKSLLVSWKARDFLRFLKVSIRAFAGAIKILSSHCFSLEKKWIPWSFSKFQFVHWQVQSTSSQTIACQLKRNEFRDVSQKGSIRALAGAIEMLPNHRLSIEQQWIPWNASKFLFVYCQVQSICFQVIACQLKSNK